MPTRIPEKARLLQKLKEAGFNVPDFVYVPADNFRSGDFNDLEAFLARHRENFKVIARSAHAKEEYFKGGTFDSLETYGDINGIKYARQRMISYAATIKRLSILRQQRFLRAPQIDPEDMGVIVMPFIYGLNVMAKMLGNKWEFGYCPDKLQGYPYITTTPHDERLFTMSQDMQDTLGFLCELEYIVTFDGQIVVMQAKNVSHIETLSEESSRRSIQLDGTRRIRKSRNYRERPVYVMDTFSFYRCVIDMCLAVIARAGDSTPTSMEEVEKFVDAYQAELEEFALKYERYAVLGLSIDVPESLRHEANSVFDNAPTLQKNLSHILHQNQYFTDSFLAEADTLISKDKIRISLCGHDAYGIDTVRNPLWSVYWDIEKDDQVVRQLRAIGFRTGDTIGIDIESNDKPTVYRL